MDIVYLICSLAAPDLCEPHRVRMYGADQISCMMTANAELARFVPDGWTLARWQCVEPGAAGSLQSPAASGDG